MDSASMHMPLVLTLVGICVHIVPEYRLTDRCPLISETPVLCLITREEQGMVAQVQAQPAMHQVLLQTPDGRLRPPYPPLHPPACYAQPRPLAPAHLGGVPGQQLMLVMPHSPQVTDAVASTMKNNKKQALPCNG